MAKISSKYHEEFAKWLKTVGGRWDPNARTWEIPDGRLREAEAKAKELGVRDFKVVEPPKPKPKEGVIMLSLSKNGRFAIISLRLLAFTEDLKELLEGKRKTVRFRVLPPQT